MCTLVITSWLYYSMNSSCHGKPALYVGRLYSPGSLAVLETGQERCGFIYYLCRWQSRTSFFLEDCQVRINWMCKGWLRYLGYGDVNGTQTLLQESETGPATYGWPSTCPLSSQPPSGPLPGYGTGMGWSFLRFLYPSPIAYTLALLQMPCGPPDSWPTTKPPFL